MKTENTMTNADIEMISDAIEAATADSTTAKIQEKAAELAKNADLKLEEASVRTIINPITGKPIMVDEEDDLKPLPTLDELMADDSIKEMDIDMNTLKISDSSISTILGAALGVDSELTETDVKQIIDCVNKHKRGEKMSYYQSAPDIIKKKITEHFGRGMETNAIREVKNNIIKELYDGIINDTVINTMTVDVDKAIKAAKVQMDKEIAGDKYWGATREYFIKQCDEKAAKMRDEGKDDIADRFILAKKMFIQSYTYDEMREMYMAGKLKVKKIKIDKFKRTCDDFMLRYVKSKNEINDIKTLLPALDKKVNPKFDLDVIQEFICVFIEYATKKKLDQNNFADHVFMYYFIYNILTLDMYDTQNENDVKFHKDLLDNINNFLELIVDKRATKQQERK